MPANPSSSDAPNEADAQADAQADGQADAQAETPAEPMSRAERRAAARGKTLNHDDVPVWNTGKVGGSRGNQSNRRSYSNRRSGG